MLLLQGVLIAVYPNFRRHFAGQFSNQIPWNALWVFESNATFAHVELGRYDFRICLLKPMQQFRIAINPHMIQSDEMLLAGNADKGQRLVWRAVVSGWVQSVRNHIPNHAVIHGFLESRGQMIAHDLAETGHGVSTRFRQSLDVNLWRVRLNFHHANFSGLQMQNKSDSNQKLPPAPPPPKLPPPKPPKPPPLEPNPLDPNEPVPDWN